ncbi:MAG: TraR/DksA C4-type zinc finger protein [Marinobacterium sp.]
MTDIYDRAQARELQNQQEAEARYRASLQPEPEQQVVAGVVICIDCDEPVQPARLTAKPNAARCISCQQIHERRGQHG